MFQIPFEITSLSGLTQRPLSTLNTEETPDPNMFGLIDLVMAIQEFMTYASVTTNCAILFFTFSNFGEAGFGLEQGTSTVTKLWVIIGVEHALILFKGLLAKCIQDAPAWVILERESRAHKHIRDSQFLISQGSKREAAARERIKKLNTEIAALTTRVAQLSTDKRTVHPPKRDEDSQTVAVESASPAPPAASPPVVVDERPIVRAQERQLQGGVAGRYDGGYDSDMNEWGYDGGDYIDDEDEEVEVDGYGEEEYRNEDGRESETGEEEDDRAGAGRMSPSSSSPISSDEHDDDDHDQQGQERETAVQRAHRHMLHARTLTNGMCKTDTGALTGKDDFIRHRMASLGIIAPPAVPSLAKPSKTAGRDVIAALLEKRRKLRLLPLARPPNADRDGIAGGLD